MTWDVCIVGAGLSGAVTAERFANDQNKKVLVLDCRDHIGGNCYDYRNNDGVLQNKYGPHAFHTRRADVFDYVQRWTEWVPYELRTLARVFRDPASEDFVYAPIPICLQTVQRLIDPKIQTVEQMKSWLDVETAATSAAAVATSQGILTTPMFANSRESALARVGPRLYEWIFRQYTLKQWAKDPSQLDASVLERIPVRLSDDDRYFSDPYQALPKHGYTAMFERMLEHPNITVRLGTDYFAEEHTLRNIPMLVFTGPIDRFYASSGLDRLEYRSLSFEEHHVELDNPTDVVQPAAVINEPHSRVRYTRTVEYKHFLKQPASRSVLVREFSSADGEPYYPVPNPANRALYERYRQMAVMESVQQRRRVIFLGRLAGYKYMNMDEAIANALDQYYSDYTLA